MTTATRVGVSADHKIERGFTRRDAEYGRLLPLMAIFLNQERHQASTNFNGVRIKQSPRPLIDLYTRVINDVTLMDTARQHP